jgi:hypothetical protein
VMGSDIPRRSQIFYKDPLRYASIVKSVHTLRTRISVDGKFLEHYHIQGIAGRCYDKQLVAIELDPRRVRLHDPNK